MTSNNGFGILILCFASYLTGFFQGRGVLPMIVVMAILGAVGWLSGHFGRGNL